MARPGIESRTSDLRVRCPTDCATPPGFPVLQHVKRSKGKVSHGLVAIGAVKIRGTLYPGHSIRKAKPIPLLLLHCPILSRKMCPFSAGMTQIVFHSPAGPVRIRTRDLLHHNRVVLTADHGNSLEVTAACPYCLFFSLFKRQTKNTADDTSFFYFYLWKKIRLDF